MRPLALAALLGALPCAAQVTLANLASLSSSPQCAQRPTVGASVYAAIVAQRASGGLTDAQVLMHAASRLGFGPGPHGPLTLMKANDCTTVFVADELARQLAALTSAPVDSADVTEVRNRTLALTTFTRVELNTSMVRQQADPRGVELHSWGTYWYDARRQLSFLKELRELVGSQSRSQAGTVHDRQLALYEVLHELWLNHFNVNTEKSTTYYYGSDGYPLVLGEALGGTFEALLVKVLREPGMLYYLDNASNRCDPVTGVASNQNLARELLELHTLGIGPSPGVYGQADVEGAAAALCGWNVYPSSTVPLPSGTSGFVFNSALASPKTVRVLGVDYPPSATRVEALAKDLAKHPLTRTNVCKKLVARFYAPALRAAAQSSCETSWGATGNLTTVVTALVSRNAFWAQTNYRNLQRSPVELPLAVARAQGVNLIDLRDAAVAGVLTRADFAPATITPDEVIARSTALRSTTAHKLLDRIMQQSNTLLGAVRTEVGPPIGYRLDGAAYVSSAFIDDASRVGLEVGSAFDLLAPATRRDLGSPAARTALDQRRTSSGSNLALEWYVETQLGFGDVLGGTTSQAFVFPSAQQSVMRTVFANTASWAYHSSSSTNKRSHNTLLGLTLGTQELLWR